MGASCQSDLKKKFNFDDLENNIVGNPNRHKLVFKPGENAFLVI